MKYFILLLVLIVGGGIYYFRYGGKNREIAELAVGGVKIQAEIADEFHEQALGLSGRESLCADCGMLFIFERPRLQRFTMSGMRFPLDMIFIEGGKISEIRSWIGNPRAGEDPQIVESMSEASMVLEVNAGFAGQHDLKTGDRVVLQKN